MVSYPLSPIPPRFVSTKREFFFPLLGYALAAVFHCTSILSKLLLNEEGAKMSELPCASGAEDDKLNYDPSNDTGVGRLGLISEFGLSLLERFG